MSLQFNPYPLEPWLRHNQQPDFNQQVMSPLNQGINTLIEFQKQNRADKRQEMLDRYLTSKENRDQAQFASDYGTPIDPSLTVGQSTGQMGYSSMIPGGSSPVASASPLIEQFNQWRAGGMNPQGARSDYMPALGKDERKIFQDQNSPEKQAEVRLKDAQTEWYKNRPTTPNSSGGSYTMGGIGADGQPIFYNNKTLETRTAPVPGGGSLYPRTPSQDQSNAAIYGQRAQESNQQLEQLLGGGFDPTTVAAGAQGMLPNIMQPSNVQSFQQLKRNFINATLRRESGATIRDEEMENANKQYFPQTGDSDDVLALKSQNRKTVIDSLGRIAGPMGNRSSQTGSGLMWQGRPLKDTPANRAWLQSQGAQ